MFFNFRGSGNLYCRAVNCQKRETEPFSWFEMMIEITDSFPIQIDKRFEFQFFSGNTEGGFGDSSNKRF